MSLLVIAFSLSRAGFWQSECSAPGAMPNQLLTDSSRIDYMPDLQVTVAHSPQQSVYIALREASSTRGPFSTRGVLGPVRSLVARPEYDHLLRPTRRYGLGAIVPNALVPLAAVRDITVSEQVDALHEYSAQTLLDDIENLGPGAPLWRQAAADPEQWLRTYAGLVGRCWQLFEQRWRLLRPAVDAEIERLGVASVRHCLVSALNTLSPRLTFTETGVSVDGHEPVRFEGRPLVLVPGIGARDTLFVHDADPSVFSIAYPLRSLPDVSPVRPVQDPLEVVLGVPRARVLRMLNAAQPVGAVAAELRVTPAAASRHCDVLVRAGLVTRERRGRQVLVSRTLRGDHLLDVL